MIWYDIYSYLYIILLYKYLFILHILHSSFQSSVGKSLILLLRSQQPFNHDFLTLDKGSVPIRRHAKLGEVTSFLKAMVTTCSHGV